MVKNIFNKTIFLDENHNINEYLINKISEMESKMNNLNNVLNDTSKRYLFEQRFTEKLNINPYRKQKFKSYCQ